jgi:tetratricopeptide (TPR) repeat protein
MAAIARLEWVVGDFDAAVSQTRAALKVFAAENAVQDQIAAQLLLQHESHRRGDYEEARRLLVSNLELSQSIGDLSSEARCWLGLGNAAIEEERYEEAQRDYEKSLDSARRAGDHEMIGAALTNLANQASYRGHSEAAEKWIEESIAHFGRSRWKWYRAMNLIVKGRIENELGRFEDAARSLIEAYRIAPNEKLVVWRFLMLFTKTLFGLGLQKEGTRWAGYLDRFRERIGEHYHGLEMRKFESRLAEFRAQITPAEYAEQIEIGRNMSAEEIDGTISKVRRLFLSEV